MRARSWMIITGIITDYTMMKDVYPKGLFHLLFKVFEVVCTKEQAMNPDSV